MRKRNFLKVLCCLLAVICLLPGCEHKSPLLAHADDVGDLKTDYVAIDLVHHWGYSIENREGETLSLVPETLIHKSGRPYEGDNYTMEGTMGHTKETYVGYARGSGDWYTFQVPYSQTFTVTNNVAQTAVEKGNVTEEEAAEHKYNAESRVSFYTEDRTIEQLTKGDWSKVVHHCNNVVELYGDNFEFRVCFYISEGTKFGDPRPFMDQKAVYIARGTGKGHVIIALVDGEIRTEGMVGSYTVAWKGEHDILDTRQEYDETGKLLHTDSGHLSEELREFRQILYID